MFKKKETNNESGKMLSLDKEETKMLINITRKRAEDIKAKMEFDIKQLEDGFKEQKSKIEEKAKKTIDEKIDGLKDEFLTLKSEIENGCKVKLQSCLKMISKLNSKSKAVEPITDVDLETDADWSREIPPPDRESRIAKEIFNEKIEEEI